MQSEGFSKDEAYELAQRGAELLTASHASSARDSEKPASAAPNGKAAEDTSSDSPYAYFFSKLTTTRRLALAALAVCVVIGAFTFLNNILELAKAPRTERSVGQSTVPCNRKLHAVLSLASILLLIFGLMMFTMPNR
ncbi:MAG: hypothetical protein OXL36_08885 [Bryobacterales bacterium]|nr:hypothetical protein [Bryobacterales bacterium]MDE0293005.1 hypothetical protein [Bryobacterales bacterium]